NSATLRGNIYEVSGNANYYRYFEWGTSSSNLNQTVSISGQTNSTGSFNSSIYGLNNNQTYYFRACAEVSGGGNYECGQIRNFTTNSSNSSGNNYVEITTSNATNIDSNSVTLRGNI